MLLVIKEVKRNLEKNGNNMYLLFNNQNKHRLILDFFKTEIQNSMKLSECTRFQNYNPKPILTYQKLQSITFIMLQQR